MKIPKIQDIKLNKCSLYFFLIVLTPLIDTINGYFLFNYGERGISIGTIYRFGVIVYSLFIILNKMLVKMWKWIIVIMYFPIGSVIWALINNGNIISALSYGTKWIFPIVIICCFVKIHDRDTKNTPKNIIEFWSWLVPIILITEYLLGIGKMTYYNAGFKGLFYSTNDIAFALTMLSIYSLYRVFFEKIKIKTAIPVFLNFIAIIILSTKSSVIFFVITIVWFLLLKSKKNPKVGCYLLIMFVVVGILLTSLLKENISKIIERYIIFYEESMSHGKNLRNFLGFLTSARTYRIENVVNELLNEFRVYKLLFGWQPPYNTGAIEMDWLDVFFQHGIVGLCLLISFYKKVVFSKAYTFITKYMLIVAMICAFFSGHVLNGALPSTVFAVVVGLAVYTKKESVKNFL